uniref:Uncharacterized protein n=1 Tax=Fagus sylvatica TaxID=28930 RepID=A0A2N9FJB8_FAGSY
MVPEKMVHGSISQSPEKWKESWSSTPPSGPRRITQRSTANSVTKTICGGASCSKVTKKMTKRMRQGLKRPRNLPWPPKSVPAEVSNDERQAGYFLCPLVAVDFITNHHNSRATTTTAQHSGGPCSSTSWNLGSKVWRADFKSSKEADNQQVVHGTLPVVNDSLPTPKSPKFYDYYISLSCSSFFASHRESQVYCAQPLGPRH